MKLANFCANLEDLRPARISKNRGVIRAGAYKAEPSMTGMCTLNFEVADFVFLS